MKIESLKWDSDFFCMKVSKVDFPDMISQYELEALQNLDTDLAYCFVNNPTDDSIIMLESLGANLVDIKVTFEIVIDNRNIEDTNFSLNLEPTNVLTKDLENLTYESGIYSRFKRDILLSHKFEPLYKLWIDKSLNGRLADQVFIAKNMQNIVIGFITCKMKEKVGSIGLIAVHHSERGKKVGTSLLTKVYNWCKERGAERLEVVTQSDNLAACKLYEKFGYTLKNKVHIYHYWKKHLNDSI
ncbi:MAG: GNAT family N-acetyltransferase [Chitinophagaceae bacterium]|nr:GNAT family N-acetyltransferase [Chitinophagaceae bacterium]